MTVEDSRASQGGNGSRMSRNRAVGHTEIHVSKYNSASLNMSTPGIKVPMDMTVAKMLKSKNESGFTTSLLHGDLNGYTVGKGVQNEIFAKKQKRNQQNMTTKWMIIIKLWLPPDECLI